MEKTTCDFCHRDNSDDMEKICGKLHVQKLNGKYVAAHHKCMQYSAQLIQYKSDDFGGFKVNKVFEEIKRGKFLKCTICKGNRGKRKKSKDGYNVNGATAGCALLSCRKTYHYCCANSDPTAITKRMLIKYKDQGKQVVMYRVFCCLDHEKKFRSNKSELYLPFQSGKNSSSESSSEDDDDDDVDEDDDDEEEDDEEAGGEEEVSMSDSGIEGKNNNSMSDSDIEGINNNDVCTPDNSDRFDGFINDISALSQDESKSLQENINASAMEDNERSAGMFDQVSPEKQVNKYPKADRQNSSELMFDDEDDDFDDVTGDLSPQLKSLYDNWSDEEQKQNEPLTTDDNSKNQFLTNNVIVKHDRIPDTPHSIKIKAQINHVPDPKPKNSTSAKRAQGTKRSLLSKLRYDESSDDDIISTPDNRNRPSQRCTKNDGTNSHKNSPTGEKKKNVGKRIYSSSSSCSDSTDDEKHAKKKHSMQSVERSKNESEMDNSPVIGNNSKLNGAESTFLGQQVVLNIKKESAEMEENTVVDVENTETRSLDNVQNKCVFKELSVKLERIDCDAYLKIKQEEDSVGSKPKQKENHVTNKQTDKMDNNVCKKLSSTGEKSISKKPKLSEHDDNDNDTSNQIPSVSNCYLNLESDTSGSSTESEEGNHKDRSIPTCGLILTQDLNYSDSIRLELLEQAEKELGIEEENVAFWLDAFKMEKLQKEIMPHLMNDIGQKLCSEDGNKGKIATLLTTADKLHSQLPNYSYVLNLNKSMDKSVVRNMQENMFKQLRNSLSRASKKVGYTVGKLLTVQNMNALIVTVNDKLDPKGLIRRKLSPVSSNTLFHCSSETRLHMLNISQSKIQNKKEEMKIINFIRKEFEENFALKIEPFDEVFQSAEIKNSSVKNISDSLFEFTSDEDVDSKKQVLCLCPVDTNIVNYSAYCKKMLTQCPTIHNKNSRFIAIIHLDSNIESVDDIISSGTLEELDLCVLTSHDPKENPVSCVIVTNIPYNPNGWKVAATRSSPRQCQPIMKITKEVTQVIRSRSSPRKEVMQADKSSPRKKVTQTIRSSCRKNVMQAFRSSPRKLGKESENKS